MMPHAPVAGRTATRTDPVSHVSEAAAFVTAGEDELFCVVYRPASTPRGGVVICCSILAEDLMLSRTETLAARTFAANGFAVIRFHYRGAGHSGGEPEAATLGSMIDDAFVAADFLADATGVRSVAFCGARFGATVAGLAACQRPDSPLAMWEPAIDGDRFLGETLRAQQMISVAKGAKGVTTKAQVLQEMRNAGYVDVLGYPFSLRLYESTVGRSLAEVANGPSRPILLIQVSTRKQLKPDFVELTASCRRNGSPVETALIECAEAWALDVVRQSTDALIRTTVDWLGRPEVASRWTTT